MRKARVVKVSQADLEQAVVASGLSPENAQAIWSQLNQRPEANSHFGAAHVGYYFGALLVIGAMGWFMTSGWDAFQGWQISAIAVAYAAVFVLVGHRLWSKPIFRIPAGLLVTIAVCMVPLMVFGLERQFHLWPSTDPGSYTRFHPYINASWVLMEVATVIASMVALRFFPFPFLTAPAAYALWYLSMDGTALVFKAHWTYQDVCHISIGFGLVMLLVSYWLDHRTELDYSFWGYLFGLMTFCGGLSLLESHSQLAKFGYCLIHLALIVLSLVLQRKVFLVFGGLGVFGYLCNEAYTYFRNSMAFPFVLSFIGIAVIFAAMQFKKNEAALQAKAAGWFPHRGETAV